MIPRKDSNNKNCYVADPVDTIIDPIESNFFQINVQGRLYNNDGGKIDFFRDKDCKSFKFVDLPKIDPGAIIIPTPQEDSTPPEDTGSTPPEDSTPPMDSPPPLPEDSVSTSEGAFRGALEKSIFVCSTIVVMVGIFV